MCSENPDYYGEMQIKECSRCLRSICFTCSCEKDKKDRVMEICAGIPGIDGNVCTECLSNGSRLNQANLKIVKGKGGGALSNVLTYKHPKKARRRHGLLEVLSQRSHTFHDNRADVHIWVRDGSSSENPYSDAKRCMCPGCE